MISVGYNFLLLYSNYWFLYTMTRFHSVVVSIFMVESLQRLHACVTKPLFVYTVLLICYVNLALLLSPAAIYEHSTICCSLYSVSKPRLKTLCSHYHSLQIYIQAAHPISECMHAQYILIIHLVTRAYTYISRSFQACYLLLSVC